VRARMVILVTSGKSCQLYDDEIRYPSEALTV
jgi:hypothetical protein